MPVYYQQLEGSIRLKSCSASLGCPQPSQAGAYDWLKLEAELPLSAMMNNVQVAWKWIGRIDQDLVVIFVPMLIVLMVKVRRLENALTPRQGAVNVAVSAPAMMPMQNLATAATRPTATAQRPAQSNVEDPYYVPFC